MKSELTHEEMCGYMAAGSEICLLLQQFSRVLSDKDDPTGDGRRALSAAFTAVQTKLDSLMRGDAVRKNCALQWVKAVGDACRDIGGWDKLAQLDDVERN